MTDKMCPFTLGDKKNSTCFILRDKKVFKKSLDMKMCTIFECATLTMNEKAN